MLRPASFVPVSGLVLLLFSSVYALAQGPCRPSWSATVTRLPGPLRVRLPIPPIMRRGCDNQRGRITTSLTCTGDEEWDDPDADQRFVPGRPRRFATTGCSSVTGHVQGPVQNHISISCLWRARSRRDETSLSTTGRQPRDRLTSTFVKTGWSKKS